MNKALGIICLLIAATFFLNFLPKLFGIVPAPAANESVILISEDNGRNFKSAIWHSPVRPEILDIKNSEVEPAVFYAATGRGLFLSRDSGQNWYEWTDLEKKLSGAAVHKIALDVGNPGRIFVSFFKDGSGQVAQTKDNFFSLEPVFEIAGQAVFELEFSDAVLYLGLSDGRLLSYKPTTKEFRSLAGFGSAVIDVEAVNGAIYAASRSNGIFVSFNGGQSFRPAGDDGLALVSAGRLKSLAVEQRSGNRLYAASLGGLFQSFNRGLSWEPSKTITSRQHVIELVALSPNNELYLAAGNKLYRQINPERWQIVFNLKSRRISSIYFVGKEKIIVGTK